MSSMSISTLIELSPKEWWRMGILDIDDFRQVLKTKRGDQRPKLSQPAISLELEKVKVKPSSQGTISNLEIRGRSALMNSWPDPRDRVTLLRIYGFTTEELIELDKIGRASCRERVSRWVVAGS